MFDYIRRLVTTGAAYTASSIVAKVIALALLPLYTRFLTPADYGAAEVLLAAVIILSIFVRLGIIEALLRFYHRFQGSERDRAVKTSFTFLLATTTLGAAIAWQFAGPLSELLLGEREEQLMQITIFGLWVFTNYELLLALFRLDERARSYFLSSVSNVLLTVCLTVWLVVVEGQKAKGLLLGNFLGSAVLYIVLLYVQRRRLGLTVDRSLLKPMLRFGVPTMPAELSLFSLFFIDRVILSRSAGVAAAGLYSIAVKFSQVVTVLVRAFQLAWPPLAYSIRDDDQARRAFSLIVTYYVLLCGWFVTGLALLSRWMLRLLVDERFFPAYKAMPLVATGVVLYGLYLVLVVVMGRVGKTGFNFPVTALAAVVNIGLNLLLVPRYEIVGAGVALGLSYLVMLAVMYAISRRYFAINFQWRRLLHIVVVAAGLIAFAELLLPTSGAAGFMLRSLLFFGYLPILFLTGFLHRRERTRLSGLWVSGKGFSLKSLQEREALDEGPELARELHDAQDPD